ncbi:MAG: 3'-5' exonuclease [Phocaeicola sp.]
MTIIKNKIPKTVLTALPKVIFPGRIYLIYTAEEADRAIEYLNQQQVVGVDTETRPSFKKGTSHKVSLVQISTMDTCFLFRLNAIGMPESLQSFLMGDVLKIGLSLKDDFTSLRRRTSLRPDEGNWIELQDYVVKFGIEDKSLQKIYANLFGFKISKTLRLSNWEAAELTEGQQRYAATDAWACVQIYKELKKLEESGNYTLDKEDIKKE